MPVPISRPHSWTGESCLSQHQYRLVNGCIEPAHAQCHLCERCGWVLWHNLETECKGPDMPWEKQLIERG